VSAPFGKVLIANRGEIAVRVIRACRELGIKTVAVFSEADRESLHVLLADEAVPIGPPPATESYLVIDKLIAAARATGAEAVHPGYGFLAENAKFAQACLDAKLTFIGPPPAAIRAMGDKMAARRVAIKMGVPVVPGTEQPVSDDAEAVRVAERVGYPVMLKAAMGGGGKGMRLVRAPGELTGALRAARSEAGAAFGDAAVYIERYVEEPRHIEIQILADAHGGVVYLGERECSIQRRHQKLVEESPSPFVTPEMRRRMGEAACRVAAAVGYVNAGTVEFLVDRERNFYFLEMNTRLQVEHPVTELVTGRDLVKDQLRIAAGEKLGFGQDDVVFHGWAIECRVNAEDPFASFIPSPGKVLGLQAPGQADRLGPRPRCGDRAHGPRPRRVHGGRRADHDPDPPAHRRAPGFRGGPPLHRLHGAPAGRGQAGGGRPAPHGRADRRGPDRLRAGGPSGARGGSACRACRDGQHLAADAAAGLEEPVKFEAQTGGETIPVEIAGAQGRFTVTIAGEPLAVDARETGEGIWSILLDGTSHVADVTEQDGVYVVDVAGERYAIRVEEESRYIIRTRGAQGNVLGQVLKAPMPGKVTLVEVAVGQAVAPGDGLIVLEAMKMENEFKAQVAGTVKEIRVAAGQAVNPGDVLLVIE
jgi:acetyl-CoA carboxylase biotin carboxylase subunit